MAEEHDVVEAVHQVVLDVAELLGEGGWFPQVGVDVLITVTHNHRLET